MNDLRKKFLSESVEQLKQILSELKAGETLSQEFRQSLFRTFHTVKGNAQVFGLKEAAKLAHQLESLISNPRETEQFKTVFEELVKDLISALNEGNTSADNSSDEKISVVTNNEAELTSDTKVSDATNNEAKLTDVTFLPSEILHRLSPQEKEKVARCRANGDKIYVLSKHFAMQNFLDSFKSFRDELSSRGELIATLPKTVTDFQFIFSSSEELEKFDAEVIAVFEPEVDLEAIVTDVLRHGREIAEFLGKSVKFESRITTKKVPEKYSKLIFDALIHLVRNAIDHGIEKQGTVKIEISEHNDEIVIKVADDGRGINLEEVKKKAIEKGLISQEEEVGSEAETSLIFLPGLSTASNLSEISGRGFGLDLVKAMVENKDGKIQVETSNLGTVFEIRLKKQRSFSSSESK